MKAVDIPASKLDTANSQRDGNLSARFSIADPREPITKPICTAMVSQAAPPSVNCHNLIKMGVTADAENQTAIPNNSANASSSNVRHFPGNAPEYVSSIDASSSSEIVMREAYALNTDKSVKSITTKNMKKVTGKREVKFSSKGYVK